jgi:hypothetical protein
MWATGAMARFGKFSHSDRFMAVFWPFFGRYVPKTRHLRASTHSLRSIQLGIERDISSTGFRHPNQN